MLPRATHQRNSAVDKIRLRYDFEMHGAEASMNPDLEDSLMRKRCGLNNDSLQRHILTKG